MILSAVRRIKGDNGIEGTGTSGQRVRDGLSNTGAAPSNKNRLCRYPGMGMVDPWETLRVSGNR